MARNVPVSCESDLFFLLPLLSVVETDIFSTCYINKIKNKFNWCCDKWIFFLSNGQRRGWVGFVCVRCTEGFSRGCLHTLHIWTFAWKSWQSNKRFPTVEDNTGPTRPCSRFRTLRREKCEECAVPFQIELFYSIFPRICLL